MQCVWWRCGRETRPARSAGYQSDKIGQRKRQSGSDTTNAVRVVEVRSGNETGAQCGLPIGQKSDSGGAAFPGLALKELIRKVQRESQ
jgi:hypothetical protein